MLVSSLPDGYPEDDRVTPYVDADLTKYEYSVHASGSLVVWKQSRGKHSAEVVYGPSAWESVQGDSSASLI